MVIGRYNTAPKAHVISFGPGKFDTNGHILNGHGSADESEVIDVHNKNVYKIYHAGVN